MSHTASPAVRPPVCSAVTVLPDPLARIALVWAGDFQAVLADVRDLRCTLERHTSGDHYAFVREASRTTAVWARWPDDGSPHALLILPDCPATHPAQGGCCEFEGHAGGHSWQLQDPCGPGPGVVR